MSALEQSLLELIRRASTELSPDVLTALQSAHSSEDPSSNGRLALELILESQDIARTEHFPLSAQTSWVRFYLRAPSGHDLATFEDAAAGAVAAASKEGLLAANLIDPLNEKPFRTNVGPGNPACILDPEPCDEPEVRVLIKGDGAENSGAQISLPDPELGMTVGLLGVRRAILHSLLRAQGRGCGPGVVGVAVGGDRAGGLALAERQLLRPLNDRNSTRVLARLEKQIVEDASQMGLGPMGFGGKSTLLAAKVAVEAAPHSSCFVSVAYAGWTFRRQGIRLDKGLGIAEWLYDGGGSGGANSKTAKTSKTSKATKRPAEKETKKATTKTTKTAAKKSAKKTAKKATKKSASGSAEGKN